MTDPVIISPAPVWANLVPGMKMEPAWALWIDELRRSFAGNQTGVADLAPIGPEHFPVDVEAASSGGSPLPMDVSDLQSQIQDLQMSATPRPEIQSLAYATFVDTTTQTAAAINTAYSIKLSDQYLSSGIYRDSVNTSRVYVTKSGVFNFQFSVQMTKSSASLGYAYIWFRINGVDAPFSASRLAFQGSNTDIVPSWNWFMPMKADDYFELMWAADSTAISIFTLAAPAFAPAIPSVILTVNEVSL